MKPFYNFSKPRPIYIYELHSKYRTTCMSSNTKEIQPNAKTSHPIYISCHDTTAPSQQPKQ
jgi:hypothetical protein